MEISDDPGLLDLMVADAESAEGIYQPGPYWIHHTHAALRQIKRLGIRDFRGASNTIGLSFTDSVYIDASTTSASAEGQAAFWLLSATPLRRKFYQQVRLTRSYWDKYLCYRNFVWAGSDRVGALLDRYVVSDSVSAGCIDVVEVGGRRVSAHYLQVLDTHDRLATHVDYNAVSALLEIGGGFGAYVHLLATNYPNIRKFLYLDIAPNLYIGTQYLRSIFGDSVRTYRDTREQQSISFRDDGDLEIICIAPYQLQAFEGTVEHVHNAHSFVEMPREVIANYARLSEGILASNGMVTLVSYDRFNHLTINPEDLPTFFRFDFTRAVEPTLTLGRSNYHFVGRR